MNKGFVFSLEAIIALLFLGSALLFMFQPTNFSLKEVVVLQQANDLVRVWSISYPSKKEILQDSEMVFGERVEVKVDGQFLKRSVFSGENVSTNAILLDDFLIEHEFVIVVYTGDFT